MTKDLFDKYIWLVDTIYRDGKITFEEINERWLRSRLSEGEDIPLRTFHNWRIAIEQVFDININCNRKGGLIAFRRYPIKCDWEQNGNNRYKIKSAKC